MNHNAGQGRNEQGDEEGMGDFRYRHHCKPFKVYGIARLLEARDDGGRRRAIFDRTGFGRVLQLENWTGLPQCFVKFVVRNFDPEEMALRLKGNVILKLYKQDVARVYGLPSVGRQVKVKGCTQKSMDKLRDELGLKKVLSSSLVSIEELEHKLATLENDVLWSKAAILYILGTLLTPRSHSEITLHYADILQDYANLHTYDWCQHILDYMEKGIPRQGIKSPKADFHFLLINYLERMAKDCKIESGTYVVPTAQGWDIADSELKLKTLASICGLELGVVYGWSTTVTPTGVNATPYVAFDPDLCPVSKAPIYGLYCKAHIRMMTTVLQTLERRMQSAGIWYPEAANDNPIPADGKQRKRKKKQSAREDKEKAPSSSTPMDEETGTQASQHTDLDVEALVKLEPIV